MKNHLLFAVLAVAFLGSTEIVSAKSNEEDKSGSKVRRARKYYDKTLYTRARFDEADSNKDGILDRDEINSAAKKFEKQYGGLRLDRADANGDGVLSFEECKKQKQWEKQHQKAIREKYKERDNSNSLSDKVRQAAGEQLSASEQKYVKNNLAEHPRAAAALKNDALNNPAKAKKTAKSMAKHPGRTKYVVDKAEDYNKAAKRAYKKAKRHQKATKKAWKNSQKTKKSAIKSKKRL